VVIAQIHPDDWMLYDEFYDLARAYRDRLSFVISPAEEGATRSVVVCHNNRDGEVSSKGSKEEGRELEDFVKECGERRVPELSRGRWEEYKEVSSVSWGHWMRLT
jgi:hypothetical protein